MIKKCDDLSVLSKKYGEDFILDFKEMIYAFYAFQINEKSVGQFVIFTDKNFNDCLFFGCFDLQDEKYDLKNFKDELISVANILKKETIIGPIDFTIWFGNRFKTNGFVNNYWWEPAGKPWLKDKLINLGFETDKKYLTHFFDKIEHLSDFFKPSYEKSIAAGFKFLDFKSEYEKDSNSILKICYELNCNAFKDSHFYTNITLDQYNRHIFSKILQLDNSCSCFIADQNERIVGYCFTILDIDSKGPIVILKSILVHPDFQSFGLSTAMVYDGFRRVKLKNINRGAGALVREGAKSEFLFSKIVQDLSKSHQYELFNFKILKNI
jgi:hypothetical protein